MALQTEADLLYIVDDDMIPGRKMLQILSHVAGTEKYKNSVLGSIGRILPFRQKDFTFPSYRKFRSKEAGLYLPDPAYDITVDKIVQVDFLSSSWFLSAELVKTLFIEAPMTFMTGEDLHLRYVHFLLHFDHFSFLVKIKCDGFPVNFDLRSRLDFWALEFPYINNNIISLSI
jgi:hypothetical protein